MYNLGKLINEWDLKEPENRKIGDFNTHFGENFTLPENLRNESIEVGAPYSHLCRILLVNDEIFLHKFRDESVTMFDRNKNRRFRVIKNGELVAEGYQINAVAKEAKIAVTSLINKLSTGKCDDGILIEVVRD